jgi:transitional endoplasmic reticulum ATPase
LTEKYHKGVELTVMESEPDKVGTGYVSISREVMNELGLVPGDVIEIAGKKITHALVWPFRRDKDNTIIRMDGTIRKNAGVSLGDIVTINPAKLKQATRIILVPLNQSIPPDFISYLKVRLIERQFYNPRPVTKSDIINISIGIGGVSSFVVLSVTPDPAGMVTDSTEIVIGKEALKEEALQILITPNLKEVERHLNQMPKEDRRVLSVACSIIEKIMNKDYPSLAVKSSREGFIGIHSPDEKHFSEIVSSVLEKDLHVPDIRTLFYKYLLGFQPNIVIEGKDYEKDCILKIYPFAVKYIKGLASEVRQYIRVLNESEVKFKLKEIYDEGNFLKLSVIQHSLSIGETKSKYEEFLSYFFGIAPELLQTIKIEGIINKGYVNPLVYEYVQQTIKSMYEQYLKELKYLFKGIFNKAEYKYYEENYEFCIFRKPLEESIYVYFSPWPKYINIRVNMPEKSIKAIVIQGLPANSILDYFERYKEYKKFIWIFVDKEKTKIVIASNTYKSEIHDKLLKILRDSFTIDFLSPISEKKKLKEEIRRAEAAIISETVPRPKKPIIKRLGRDVLEDVVASVLKDLGFTVKVGKFTTKAGTEIEIDIWGEKSTGNTKFIVYASCKNLDEPVKFDVIREEKGRIDIMKPAPHLKIIVVNLLKDSAKKEAASHGFLVIELGEKVHEGNAEKAYLKVYETLSKLFA